jgi:mRNA interferase RelE/StbE
MSGEWDWEFTSRGESEFQDLDAAAQQQLLDKLDEVVTDEFRSPPEYLKSLTNLPYSSLRAGSYRAIIRVDRDTQMLTVMSVGHRSHVYDDFP